MDIYWYGQSFFKIKGKTATIVIDPFDPEMVGLKLPKEREAQIVLSTHNHGDHNNVGIIDDDPLVITGPGEYEKLGVTIVGIPSYHDKSEGLERGKNTIYHIVLDGINIVHLGDLGHTLTEDQTTLLDKVDILMIPVGGNYTISADEAAKVAAELEPKVVIPMHYRIDGLKIEVEDVEPFLKEMGAENIEPISKLTITKDKLPDEATVVVLNNS